MDVKLFLQQNVMPVTGCSEPAAIAYATSVACQALGGSLPPRFACTGPVRLSTIRKITVQVDRNVFRNAFSAVIPGTDGLKGPAAAAAAGIFLDPQNGLDLFSGITPEIRTKARLAVLGDKISCSIHAGSPKEHSPDIRVEVMTGEDAGTRTAVVRLAGRHDCIRQVTIDGSDVFTGPSAQSPVPEEIPPPSVTGMIRVAEAAGLPEIEEVYRGVAMNMALAEQGIHRVYGLGLGRNLHRALASRKGQPGMVDTVRIASAVAADARMGGAPYPVMSTAGSGNQGITALVPLGVIGRECGFSREEIGRAGLLCHMVTWQMDRQTGRLSALCGCSVKAGIGAAAGIASLIGGGPEEVTTAINLMAATVTGTICDGAKPGCSLKIAMAAGMAAESAFLAVAGMKIPEGNGIVGVSAADTFAGIGKISRAMDPVNAAIIGILEGHPAEIPE